MSERFKDGYVELKVPVNNLKDGDQVLGTYGRRGIIPFVTQGQTIGEKISLAALQKNLQAIGERTILVLRKIGLVTPDEAKARKLTSNFGEDVRRAYEEFNTTLKPVYESAADFLNNVDLASLEENGDLSPETHERLHESPDHQKFRELIEAGILNEASLNLLRKLKENLLPLVAVFGAYAKSTDLVGEQECNHVFRMLTTHFDLLLKAGVSEEEAIKIAKPILLHDLGYLIAYRELDKRIVKPEMITRTHGILAYRALVTPDNTPIKGIDELDAKAILGHPFRYDGANGQFKGADGKPTRVFVSEEYASHYPSLEKRVLTPEAMELRILEEFVSYAFGDPAAGILRIGTNGPWRDRAVKSLERVIYDEGSVDPVILSRFLIQTPLEILPKRTRVEVDLSDTDQGTKNVQQSYLMGVVVNTDQNIVFLYETGDGVPLNPDLPEGLPGKNILKGEGRKRIIGIDGREYVLVSGIRDTHVKLVSLDELSHIEGLKISKIGLVDSSTYGHVVNYLKRIGKTIVLQREDSP